MKRHTLLFILLIISQITFAQAPRPFPAGLPTCLEDDFRELEKFYDATGGSNWTNKTGWFSADLKAWYGIKLTSDECNVKNIQLLQNKLQGNWIELMLPELDTFNCYGNSLIGTIPNFSNLSKLKHLNCSNNKLSGNIPNFSNLSNLTELYCTENQLTGTIPDFSNLPNLVKFHCYINKLNGNIPNFSNLPNLTELYCTNNQLTGTIPDFSNLPNLNYLNCSANNLSGTIPDFSNLPNLNYFGCTLTQLSGSIPNFSNLPKLTFFHCQVNPLMNGTIPNFTNLPNLEVLKLYSSSFTGNIPNFSNCPKLEIIDVELNDLTGSIPNFPNLPNLELLNLSSNSFSGKIPNFSNLPKLQSLRFRNNELTDTIPNFNLPELTELNLFQNKLTYCPDFTLLPKLEYLDIENNELEHNLPSFSNCSQLKRIILNNNKLTGTIPDFAGLNNLNYVSLRNNKLNGNISTVFPSKLTYLGASNNYFNFGNLEQAVTSNLNKISYQPQLTKLPLTYINNKLIASLAGSDLSKLTYKWFRNNTLLATTPNLNEQVINKSGKYYYAVNHSILTKLTLLSDTLTIGAVVKGKVFTDANNNCTLDNSEKGRKEIILRFESSQDTVITVSDSLGNYQVALDTFNYTIYVKTGNLWKLCPLPNIKFNSWTDTLNLNIPMQVKVSCPEMHVDLSTIRLRRCFDNSYTIKYANKGTIAANNAYIIVDFDKWLTVKSASKPYIQLPGNQYRFDIGTVQSDEEEIITVIVNVNCDSTILGQTHCSTAHIYPDSACVTSSLWDNSSLTIKAKCQSDKVTFEVKNDGTSPTSQARQSIVIEDQIMMFQTPINLGSGESKFFEFSPFGKTVRMSIEQAEYHPSNNAFVSAAVEGCGGNPTLGMITQFSINDNEPWKDTDCRQNIGAYDPNEKLAYPKGYGELHLIEPNTEIEYQINFQNEGSDTAFTVVLRDTINSNLDITTINMVSSSHPYSWTLEDRNTLKVTFNHINLTTKKEAEAKSQGFIRFRIAQNKDLPSGKAIKNRAGIYFDFNQPIMTNTTFHRVGRNFVLVAVPNVEISNLEVKVSPNPLHNQAIFEIKNADSQNFTLKIFDQLGRILHQQSTDNGQVIFQNTLSQGIYFYRIENEKGMASGKLMVY